MVKSATMIESMEEVIWRDGHNGNALMRDGHQGDRSDSEENATRLDGMEEVVLKDGHNG